MSRLLASTLIVLALGAPAFAEPILGTWRLSNGETVSYRACSQGYCSTVETGRYAGKTVGTMRGRGNSYTGQVVDPSNDRAYDGRVEIKGDELELTGCVAKVFCRSQTWKRAKHSG